MKNASPATTRLSFVTMAKMCYAVAATAEYVSTAFRDCSITQGVDLVLEFAGL